MAHYSCDDGKCADLRGVARTRGIPAAGTLLRGEVEAFLAVSGTKASILGEEAAGNRCAIHIGMAFTASRKSVIWGRPRPFGDGI